MAYFNIETVSTVIASCVLQERNYSANFGISLSVITKRRLQYFGDVSSQGILYMQLLGNCLYTSEVPRILV
jgi:hypothetical protein